MYASFKPVSNKFIHIRPFHLHSFTRHIAITYTHQCDWLFPIYSTTNFQNVVAIDRNPIPSLNFLSILFHQKISTCRSEKRTRNRFHATCAWGKGRSLDRLGGMERDLWIPLHVFQTRLTLTTKMFRSMEKPKLHHPSLEYVLCLRQQDRL